MSYTVIRLHGKLIGKSVKQKTFLSFGGKMKKRFIFKVKNLASYEVVDVMLCCVIEINHKNYDSLWGPFQFTSKQMVEACLETKTHYTDISGEFTVFEMLAAYDAKAKAAGIMIAPGTGFDVVPSDCLALHLKKQLPSATHLQLAFTSLKGGLSRGTARTAIEGWGMAVNVRENGKLKPFR